MNNDQFRRLLGPNSSKSQNVTSPSTNASKANAPASLGSRLRSSIPMTPRHVRVPGQNSTSSEFARQLAERKAGSEGKTAQKVRTSVPKGSRLAAGFSDRAAARREAGSDDEDERAKRIQALEEEVKAGRMEQEEFEKMRDEITGGDLGATHLVKGLDFKLLERVRRGEDVYKEPPKEDQETAKSVDVDDEFDELEKTEVVSKEREEKVKQGAVAQKKQTRNEILAALKASRQAAKAAAKPKLGAGFKAVVKPGARLEIDDRGREVMIVTDADGNVKRKVRKSDRENDRNGSGSQLLEVDKDAVPLGMVVPERAPTPPEPEIEDIFENVPEYDPLAGLTDSSDDDEAEGDAKPSRQAKSPDQPAEHKPTSRSPDSPPVSPEPSDSSKPPPIPATVDSHPTRPTQTTQRNYFASDDPSLSVLSSAANPLSDPSLIANLIAKSRHIDPSKLDSSSRDGKPRTDDEAARLKRKAAMLGGRDRDMDDMDLGFGGSRMDDADEMEMEAGGKGPKLAEWRGMGGADDDDDDESKDRGGKKRKRGPKKKKADKNSADSVMKLVEMRKGEK